MRFVTRIRCNFAMISVAPFASSKAMIRIATVLFAALVTTVGACGGGKEEVAAPQSSASTAAAAATKVTSLSLPSVIATALGATAQVTAQAKDKSGAAVTGVPLAWSVADASVASVDANGKVTPVRAGFTTVSASVNGVVASATVSIRGPV
ncbi:MAG: hypothetical protein M3Z16_12145, partial [Pseudomonadota bacterium]|nr:hypothetical protein [Pseudomonadota bacterium]